MNAPSSNIVYYAKGSPWKVIGNSNAAIAILVLILLLAFAFIDPSSFPTELLLPAILLEIGLAISWVVLIIRQSALTYLSISTTHIHYSQPRFQGLPDPLQLALHEITGVRIESGNVVILTSVRRYKLEFIGQARTVAGIINQLLAQQKKDVTPTP